MERNCKNCHNLVYAGKNYCSSCGAKWIEKRITMRHVASDFGDMYLGFDTKFVRTFIDLFRRPEAVITGYINGRRMNYVDAVRYVFISLFILGLFMFIMKQLDIDVTSLMHMQEIYENMGYTPERIAQEMERQRKLQEMTSQYIGLILFASIPLLAFIARLTFWGKNYYNFTEQMVFFMYTYSHATIATSVISISIVVISPDSFMYWSAISYLLIFIYTGYCYKRCFRLNWQELILKTLMTLVITAVVLMIVTIIASLLVFLGMIIYGKFINPTWDPKDAFPQ